MLIQYIWPEDAGDAPEMGTWLDISGDPDRPVLRGAVARVAEDEEGTLLSILMADGQTGAEEFQVWLHEQGDLGVAISGQQAGVL